MASVLAIIEWVGLGIGLIFVIMAMFSYSLRKRDILAPIKIFFNRVNDLQLNEFNKLRIGVGALLLTLLIRFVRLIFFPL